MSKPDSTLRQQIIRSLSIAQVHDVDAQGEAIIEREADEILAKIREKLPEEKDERLNKTSGGRFSPPQLLDIEARGWNNYRKELLRRLGL